MAWKRITKQQHRFATAQKDTHGGYSIEMLRHAERELLVEVWRDTGFRIAATIAGMPDRWDIIYKMLLNCDYCIITSPTRGKAMKHLGLPPEIVAEMKRKRISIRQWCNAYGCDEDRTIESMQRLAKGECVSLYETLFVERDFACLGRCKDAEIDIPPKNFLYGDITIRQGYGRYLAIARMKSGIPVQSCGECMEEAIFILKSKAAILTRISSLYFRLYSSYPMIEELVELVDGPIFNAVCDVDVARGRTSII